MTFGISMLGVWVAVQNGGSEAKVMAYTLAVVGSMQAFEALLWRDPANRAVAQLAGIVNHMQPVVFLWLCTAMLTPRTPEAAFRAQIALVAYLAMAMPYTAKALQQDKLVTVGPSGLEWAWNYDENYAAMYALFVTSLCATAQAYFDPSIVLAVLAPFTLSFTQYTNTKMVGSMWCFYSAFLPWMIPLYTRN